MASTTTTLLPLPRPTTTVSTNNKQQQQIVGGRLRHFYHEWETVTSSSWLLNTIQHGYLIPFTQPPPLTSQPQPISPLDSDQHQLIEQSIQDLLQQKAIKEVKNSTPGKTTISPRSTFTRLLPISQSIQHQGSICDSIGKAKYGSTQQPLSASISYLISSPN
ncbi:hypothetical protein G6F65_019648 [Rhizopus arrhizus]|nr:hypothetical protein G6F65_019648 [Rhizopus arrhizus]